MHAIDISENTGCEFERQHGGLLEKVWREEKGGKNN